MNAEILTAIALGIGLSASTGFRVFVPMLVASVAAHFGLLPLSGSFAWLGSWPAMICFGAATIAETLAYYIPFVDNLLDTITTPLAVGAGTLLMTSVLPVDNELVKWITGFLVGGGAAATIQGGSVLARLSSSKFTAGAGNPVVTTSENVAALGTSVLTLIIPFVIAIAFIIMAFFVFRAVFKRMKRKRQTTEQEKLTEFTDYQN